MIIIQRPVRFFISFLLILMILVMGILVPYQEAKANAALLAATAVICPEVLIPVVCAVVIASGLILTAKYTSEQIANWWWSQAGIATRQKVIDSYNGISNGVVKVSTDLYDSVRSWCVNTFAVGNNAVSVNSQTLNLNGQDLVVGRYVNSKYTVPKTYGNDVIIFGNRYQLVKTSSSSSYDKYNLYIDGVLKSNGVTLYSYPGIIPEFFFYIDSGDGKFKLGYTYCSAPYSSPMVVTGTICIDTAYLYLPSTWNYNYFGTITWDSSNVLGDSILTNTSFPNTIPKNIDNTINLAYSAALDKYYNLTYDKVISQTLTSAEPTTAPTTSTFDYTVSNDSQLDFRPLQVAGSMFTTVFPFSLPWDLYRSFTTVASEPQQPDFNIVVPDTKLLKGMRFNVDLTMFSGLFSFVRTIELIIFDICLVLLTRRLLGGAV